MWRSFREERSRIGPPGIELASVLRKITRLRPRATYSTSSRRAILGLLQSERRYLTAAEIHAFLRKKGLEMALTTVYRTLQFLTKLGAVSSRAGTNGDAAYLFCANDQHHHHAICTKCGHVAEVNCRVIDEFKKLLLARQAFSLDEHALELYGRCANCR